KNSEFVDVSSRFAAGGTRSTVPDLLKFAKGIMEGRFISSDSMLTASTSMSTREGRLTNYGMGWDTTPFGGRYIVSHSGGQQETSTLLFILPKHKLALAVGMNFESADPEPYLDRLFQLVTGAPFVLSLYSSDRARSSMHEAINSAFNYGLAHYEHFGKPMTTDPAELAKAFAYFSDTIDLSKIKANPQEVTKKIREGVHPVAQQALTKVGSYMAAKLAEKHGPARLNTYAALGALAFLEDYLGLADASVAKDFQVSDEVKGALAEMAKDWRRTNTDYVRKLTITSGTDLDALAKTLRESFKGASTYPNVVNGLFLVTRQAALSKDLPRAVKAGALAFELYPESPGANFAHGMALLMSGDSAAGLERLRKSASINPSGPASPGALNNVAYQFANSGMLDTGLMVLRIAIELHPKEANLYDSTGEFYLRKGDKAKGLEYYQKALEVDPNFPNAAVARDVVKKLSEELAQKK
ncbi:MAG TPA: serine hydrolase, partial [Pyrinomonadaceae bacterium]|nr:serine hydrolase [Pyrinomonadaceae bacterium]